MNTCSVCDKEFEDEYFDIEQNKCILHCDNKEKDIKLFWKKIREIIKEQDEDRLSVEIPFEKVYFPKCEEKGLAETLAETLADNGSNFFYQEENKFTKKLFLKECTFWDDIDFRFITFKKGLTFEKCTFNKELNFKNQTFEKGSKVRIQNSKKIANVNFENTTFKDLADFYGSNFYTVNFFKTTFEDISVFTEAVFHESVDFKYTTFEELVLFRKTIFKQEINLADSIIKAEANFLEVSSEVRKKHEAGYYIGMSKDIDVANRETARIIKHSFEKQNNIIESNRFYALELSEREKELNSENLQDLLIFKLHNIVSEHSQNWLLVLMWITLFSWFFSINTIYKNIDVSLFFYFLSIASFGLFNWFLNSCFYKEYLLKAFLRIIFIVLVVFISFQYAMSSGLDKELLNQFVLNVNPFSKIGDNISLVELVYKIFMGYLIYQFIVSVRQNTRRK